MSRDSLPASLHVHFPSLAVALGVCSWLLSDHYPPWMGFYNEFTAFLALWFLLLYLALASAGRVAFPRWSVGIAALALIPLAQTALGHIHFAGDGWMVVIYLLGLALAVASGFALAGRDHAGFASALAWVLLVGAALTAGMVVYQWLDLRFLDPLVYPAAGDGRFYANIAQPNLAATMMCLGLAALIYLRVTGKVPALAPAPLSMLLILGIVLTQARTPWIAAVFLVIWWLLKRRSVPTISASALGLGLAFYGALIVFWPHGAQTALTPATTQRSDLKQAGTHFQNWAEMFRAARNEPLWGYGWNQVSVAHVQSAHERTTYSEMLTHSHNLLLDLVIWNGVPLGLLIIGALGFWLLTRAWRCRTPESWFAILAICAVGIHNMFEYPLEYAFFLLPVGLLAGLVEADEKPAAVVSLPRVMLWPVVAAYALLLGLIWHEYRTVEADYRLMRFETRRIGSLKAAQATPDLVLLTQLREDIRFARSLARPGLSPEQLEWMRKVAYRYPHYSSLFRYSVALALNGRREEATTEFRRLYDIYGHKPYLRAKAAVQSLAETRYPELKNWQLPPP